LIIDPHAVQIFVDGSSYPNEQRRSGYAGIVIYPDDPNEHPVLFQGFRQSTISRMELSAVIAAMQWARIERIGSKYSRVQIFSDSKYVVDGQYNAPKWQKLKWHTSSGPPAANEDLWKEFLSSRAKAGVRVDIGKVGGKSTPLLRRVDKLAKTAAKSHPRVDRGLITGKIGRSIIKGPASLFPAENQVLVIRVVRSSAVGRSGENRFVFEVYDESAGNYTSKHIAYCTPTTGAQLHRQRGFRVKMNGNADYPQILEVLEEVLLPKHKHKTN
jgi:ribonuclease HI